MKNFKVTSGNGSLRAAVEILRDELSSSEVININSEPFDLVTGRSIPANDVTFVWYSFIARDTGSDAEYIRAVCKLKFGLPLLYTCKRTHKVQVALNSLEASNIHNVCYEDKIRIIQNNKVTSVLPSADHSIYRENMQNFFGEFGINLEYTRGNK